MSVLDRAIKDKAAKGQESVMRSLARLVKTASISLAQAPESQRNSALQEIAALLRLNSSHILAENKRDVDSFKGTDALKDRLLLTPARIESMAKGLEEVALLPDPLHKVLSEWIRPNGLKIRKVSTPIGVIGLIYESRPNVGVDASGLAIKSGNGLLLRGGSESMHSARILHFYIQQGLEKAGLPKNAVMVAPDEDRLHVGEMLRASGLVDLIIPRGGAALVEFVQKESRVPVLAHAAGLCHTYVHKDANPDMARKVVLNAKMRRVGICGATETLLIDEEIAPSLLPLLVEDLRAQGCTFRADEKARAILSDLPAASEKDFSTEWLAGILSIAVVANVEEALTHIRRYTSSHTEAIITENEQIAAHFLNKTQSAVAMWNASTQFCDGGEFGFGQEIGIATGHIHARGPIGIEQLTIFRYHVLGSGQVRPA